MYQRVVGFPEAVLSILRNWITVKVWSADVGSLSLLGADGRLWEFTTVLQRRGVVTVTPEHFNANLNQARELKQ